MTAPAPSARATASQLAAVAAWDVSLLRRAVHGLAAIAGRLPFWRMRLEALGRSLDSAETWSGPAAQQAAAAVLDLSAVAAALAGALDDSTAAYQRLAAEAEAAQVLALRALAHAGDLGGDLDRAVQAHHGLATSVQALGGGTAAAPADPGAALAVAALEHAAAAARSARAAGAAVNQLVPGGVVPAPTFWDLVGRLAPTGPSLSPSPPAGGRPEEVATWWVRLSAPAQLAAIAADPAGLGELDGVPAWARDRANRQLLERALADAHLATPALRAAEVVAGEIAAEEAAGRPVQLLTLDLEGDRAALALGNVDTADAVALLVPGVGTIPADDLGGLIAHARDVGAAAQRAAPALAVATVAWIGYRTPDGVPAIATRTAAWRGGARLDAALDGLAAARTAAGRLLPRTTVVAHSYGTVVVDEAADRPGKLAADAVVLLGSPGMEADAAALEAPEVYDAAAPGDPISWLGWFGSDTWAARYGSTGLPTDPDTGHSDYFAPDRPTVAAIGAVVAGVRRHD